jgi:hypothetical protein
MQCVTRESENPILQVVSGGQTGIDRAALDAALSLQVTCGGCCPKGRIAEDGRIPDKYPMLELEDDEYAHRTEQNVLSADCTVILYSKEMEGGTEYSKEICMQRKKPLIAIDLSKTTTNEAVRLLTHFISQNRYHRINFSGPKASEWPEGYAVARTIINDMLVKLGNSNSR